MAGTNEIRLMLRKHARFTVYPTSKQKKLSGIKFDDLGVFIDRGEVLVDEAVKTPLERDGTLIMELSQGRLEVIPKKWFECRRAQTRAVRFRYHANHPRV